MQIAPDLVPAVEEPATVVRERGEHVRQQDREVGVGFERDAAVGALGLHAGKGERFVEVDVSPLDPLPLAVPGAV